jgi:hypothetical protein
MYTENSDIIIRQRHAEYLEATGKKTIIFNNILWFEYNKMVVPFGPVNNNYIISADNAKILLEKFSGSFFVRTTNPNTEFADSNDSFYAVICKKFSTVEDLNSKRRNEINKALNNCVVEQVSAVEIENSGFDVYSSAVTNYSGKNSNIMNEANFKNKMGFTRKFDDIIHYWAVYYNQKLIAYAENIVYSEKELSYSVVKFHPDYLNKYSSYALFYKMNEFYLGKGKFEYVNDGYRSLYHETNIQNYLIQKFSFEKYPLFLKLHFKNYIDVGLRLVSPIKPIIRKFLPQIDAVYKLRQMQIKQKC